VGHARVLLSRSRSVERFDEVDGTVCGAAGQGLEM
jgi:hypothetical protein